jgi:hypothetical protein
VFLVMVFQHTEVLFTLAHTQFRSSHREEGVGANGMKWGTVREGKFGCILIYCFLVN